MTVSPTARLRGDEGSKLIRVRWYDQRRPAADDTVYIEQKEHHESWVMAGSSSRRRDCHSAAPPSPFSRRFKKDKEAVSVK